MSRSALESRKILAGIRKSEATLASQDSCYRLLYFRACKHKHWNPETRGQNLAVQRSEAWSRKLTLFAMGICRTRGASKPTLYKYNQSKIPLPSPHFTQLAA